MTTSIQKKRVRILGLMTGSSADGLDICLVEFHGEDSKPDYKILHSSEVKYPDHFSRAFRNPLDLSSADISRFDYELGEWFALEIAKLNLEFDTIASHGQTIKHEPPKFTLQIGNPKYMANKFKVPIIYDFRSADIKAGGQGAPLIPIVDQYLFQHTNRDILCLNIGGISNITIVPAVSIPHPILAWDTGPGNTLIDKAVHHYSNGRLLFDPHGSLAASGKLNDKLLEHLLKHPFYTIAPPKSAGQEQFGKTFYAEILKHFMPNNDQEFKDLILTLTALTARTIATSITNIPDAYSPDIVLAAGGGTKNNTLFSLLQKELPEFDVQQVNTDDITTDNKEAFGFAYLGYLHVRGLPGNIPSVTGASQALVLGITFQPSNNN